MQVKNAFVSPLRETLYTGGTYDGIFLAHGQDQSGLNNSSILCITVQVHKCLLDHSSPPDKSWVSSKLSVKEFAFPVEFRTKAAYYLHTWKEATKSCLSNNLGNCWRKTLMHQYSVIKKLPGKDSTEFKQSTWLRRGAVKCPSFSIKEDDIYIYANFIYNTY